MYASLSFVFGKENFLISMYFFHRLVLATALALKPRVMFIDEITRYVITFKVTIISH